MRISTCTALLAAVVALTTPAVADAAMVFPDGDIVREGLGDSGATVSWRTPTVSNGSLEGAPNCDPDSGDAFPTGQTVVECFAVVKICPPRQLCIIQPTIGRFDVTVTRGSGPVLSGLNPIVGATAPGEQTAAVDYRLPDASDPSGVAAGSLACNPAPGSEFPVGTTRVTCSARDSVGNESSGGFDVQVVRTPAPPTEQGTPAAPGAPVVPVTGPARIARPVALGRRLRVSRGVARVAVACPAANPVPCTGTLELRIGRRIVGRKRFTLAAGAQSTLRVRLNRAARAKLSGRRTVRLRATATTAGQAVSRGYRIRR